MIPVTAPQTNPETGLRWQPYVPLALILVGWTAMFGPSYVGLANTIWSSDANGHGPIILAVSLWLLWQKKDALLALVRRPANFSASVLLLLAVLMYVVGRSQTVWTLEIAAQNIALFSLLLFFFGWRGVRLVWFPLLFLVFMIPWPGEWIDAVTQPLKSAVSNVASSVLYSLGYPVGRSGVILIIGPYQLLVADACSGLNSLFTLEALGLLYLNLMNYSSALRNVLLAILIVPISFAANVVRVIILVLVTYHFGDEAGQGFVHGFAGMVLFLVALVLILATDSLLGLVFFKRRRQRAALSSSSEGVSVRPDVLRPAVLALVMVGASVAAVVITPRTYLSDQHAREKLADIVPKSFGAWEIDKSIVPVPPSPDLQEVLDATYDETVALTYRDREGQRVMLSLAYGRNQHKGMNTHRPEVCYPAQGFRVVQGSTPGQVQFDQRAIPVTRIVAALGARNEPITYWLLVGDQITQFGYAQRATTMRYGLHGIIPDGVLVRVSSIGGDNVAGFAVQERFIADLLDAMTPPRRAQLIGGLAAPA